MNTPTSPGAAATAPDPLRWKALAVLGLIQFIFVVDATVVNVALPRIQDDLGFSAPGLAWVVNGYTVMAAGLLLLGGRLADILGRRRMFLIAAIIFGLASAASGAASSAEMLVVSRFVQGLGEAFGVPAALGIVFVLFSEPKERMKAVGIWGGLSGIAGTLGVVLSGVLTDLASWRVLFYINVPIVLFALIVVPRLIKESRMVRDGNRFDFLGAITATLGLVSVVYALLQGVQHEWGSSEVLVPLIVGVALLIGLVGIEARSRAPLIPLWFFGDRTRAISYVAIVFTGCAFFTYVFLLTLFQQELLHFSPLQGGLANLPLGLAIGIGVGLSTGMMPKMGAKPVMVVGLIGAAVGLFLTSFISLQTSYVTGVLPGMLLFGIFFGLVTSASANTALHRVTGQESGIASAVLNVMMQIGGAIGLAGAATIALRFAAGEISEGVAPDVATASGYALAFRIAAALLLLGGLATIVFMQNMMPSFPGAAPADGAIPEQVSDDSDAPATTTPERVV
ncbi:DHA2 family efflux MFS transporter permease subunit [Catellatospora sp. KI3]|uniref:DHA2 family efflux MFS transporter permease subunit n=1 Tax=Catellatospora sp. KI3 TaxID=3041620 RepID=UPI00248227E7|nr:DHA2 family efflux MFS transporter permease subunit [Catellatospora sp. KI3]MDI1461443.1 DHA2 family efflux MFS transporter permease subunit [Catellatospora sp. KI3]